MIGRQHTATDLIYTHKKDRYMSEECYGEASPLLPRSHPSGALKLISAGYLKWIWCSAVMGLCFIAYIILMPSEPIEATINIKNFSNIQSSYPSYNSLDQIGSLDPPVESSIGMMSDDHQADISLRSCHNDKTFQESAADSVYSAFEACSLSMRQSVELLKNALGTYSFAYFPLDNGYSMTYKTYTIPGMDMVKTPNWPILGHKNTSDPLEMLTYYTNSLYTAIGDLADSRTGTDSIKIQRMEALVYNLSLAWNRTVYRDIAPELSWKKYLLYPGPRGRTWPGDIVVTWTVSSDYPDNKSALFLDKNDRIIDDQLWGAAMPEQGSMAMVAFRTLIGIQVNETISRYNLLRDLDPTGKGNWATRSILTQNNGVLRYHRVRKVLRMIGYTIDRFPDIISTFYDPVPSHVISFANKYYNASLSHSTYLSYGDIFCYQPNHYSFSTPKYSCSSPVASIGAMVFANVSCFDEFFFQLSSRKLYALRAVLMIKAFRLGEIEILPNTSACPALHSSYICLNNHSSTDPYTQADSWIKPYVLENGHTIEGTICDLDDYFGDIHDLLVRIQQNSSIVNTNYIDYTVRIATGLQLFLDTIDISDSLMVNLVEGLCK